MSDYRVTIKVQNAKLLRCMEQQGIRSLAALAETAGVGYHTVIRVANLSAKRVLNNGDYTNGVMAICDALNVMPCDLWSREMLLAPMRKTTVSIDVSLEQLSQITGQVADAEHGMLHDEAKDTLYEYLDQLPERHSRILKKRFGLDGPPMMLQEIADVEGVTKERVRQLINIAMKRFRGRAQARKHRRQIAEMNKESHRLIARK